MLIAPDCFSLLLIAGTGYVELHTGGAAYVYSDGRDWWNQSQPLEVILLIAADCC